MPAWWRIYDGPGAGRGQCLRGAQYVSTYFVVRRLCTKQPMTYDRVEKAAYVWRLTCCSASSAWSTCLRVVVMAPYYQ